MTNLQKVTEACHKANPKLLELSFGCKVKMTIGKYTSTPRDMIGIFCGKYVGQNNYAIASEEDQTMRYLSENEIEIIGRDITLEDVLMAFKALDQVGYSFDCDGSVMTYFGGIIRLEDNIWKLGKPLHEQDEKTINFLADLL